MPLPDGRQFTLRQIVYHLDCLWLARIRMKRIEPNPIMGYATNSIQVLKRGAEFLGIIQQY